jgi:hypothetical protein
MLSSGADLVRTSSHNVERAQRLNANVEAIRPVENQSSLNEDTQNALLRFARFVNREKKPKSNKKPNGKLPKGYLTQVQNVNQDERSGGMINIYA